MRWRGGRELEHEEMGEACWAFAVQLVVHVNSRFHHLDLHGGDHVFGQLQKDLSSEHVLSKAVVMHKTSDAR